MMCTQPMQLGCSHSNITVNLKLFSENVSYKAIKPDKIIYFTSYSMKAIHKR